MIVLMPNCGFLSETSRMLHIARALRARGEQVAIASHGGPYARVLDEAGEQWTRLDPVMDDARYRTYLRDLVNIGRPGVRLQPPDEVRASVRAELDFLRKTGARMVVIGFTLTAYLSSRLAGIPLAASHGASYVPPVFERGLAPVPLTMPIPGTGWLPRWLKHKIANDGGRHLSDPAKFLNRIAAELGVEPVPTLAAMMLGDLTLVTDLPEILGVPNADIEAWRPRGRAYRPGSRLVCTGPLFAKLGIPIPPQVEPFLDGSRPTVLVVLSSTTPEMLRAVVARVRAAGPRVIVGATIHDFGAVSDPDVVVAGVLPNHLVMPRVNATVTMGGQGSVQTAMTSGTPAVGIPLHLEQELNIDLAARQGMAIAIPPRHADSERMTDAVRALLEQPQYRANASRVRKIYAGVDGADRAAAAIRSYLAAQGDEATRLAA